MQKYSREKHAFAVVLMVFVLGGFVWGWTMVSNNQAPEILQGSNVASLIIEKSPHENIAPLSTSPETIILFGGDVMLSRGIGKIMERLNDFAYPFRALRELTSGADVAVVNLEGPISSRGKIYGSIYSFRADPRAVEGLLYAGIDVVSLANNHTGDYGPDALLDTLALLDRNGIGVVGGGVTETEAAKPYVVSINGLKIAFIGVTALAPGWLTRAGSLPAVMSLDEPALVNAIAQARVDGADMVAVLLHWGNEYETKHTKEQGVFARKLIDRGVTMVIGHHPHVVQEVEMYGGGVIAYSLGNFVFDQNFSADTAQGLLLEIGIQDKKITRVKEIPIRFSKTFQPFVVPNATSTTR